jgi:hypothetical protein
LGPSCSVVVWTIQSCSLIFIRSMDQC